MKKMVGTWMWENGWHINDITFQKITKAKVSFEKIIFAPYHLYTVFFFGLRNFLLYTNQFIVSTPFYKAGSPTLSLYLLTDLIMTKNIIEKIG